jgi:putative colanic acid biosynthesis acetyltransferase WcaF
MEEFSTLGPGTNCYCMDRITLLAYASVSQNAHLCTGSHDVDNPDMQLVTKPITIGANAWIGAEAFIGPGVCVGDGAILGARGVAFKDLKPGTIYIGNPARALRSRKLSNIGGDDGA